MNRLLVGSVFAEDNETQRKWLRLQHDILHLTTADSAEVEQVCVLWGGPSGDFFYDYTKVIVPNGMSKASEAHVQGLSYLVSYFREQQDNFDYFLILDSDAFPITNRWLERLLYKMAPRREFFEDGSFYQEFNHSYEIAAILRSENLETRLHASVLFAKKEALPYLEFKHGFVGIDLWGSKEDDVHLPVYQKERRHLAYPLLRSNVYNIHPLACGVYYDMFYHHCCGSGRAFNLRSQRYWDHMIGVTHMEDYTKQLMNNPVEFINKLREGK